MEASILVSTKKILGLNSDYHVFDLDITIFINSAFSTLNQLGIGPPDGFAIEDSSNSWEDYAVTTTELNWVKTYVFLKVRMMFDPPTLSYLITAKNDQIKEYECRLTAFHEYVSPPPPYPVPVFVE